jgi:predicted DNA repair protein MutK
MDVKDPAHLEETRVRGAIKTDFILSAEIMTIAMAAIPEGAFALEAATLAVVGIGITAAVYGSVALIVKMDDVGLYVAATSRTRAGRALGRGLVKGMPKVMKALSTIGTLAMLWVGGSIVVHGLEVTHLWVWPYETIHHLAEAVAHAVPEAATGAAAWATTATADGVLGLALGLLLIPVVTRGLAPAMARFTTEK